MRVGVGRRGLHRFATDGAASAYPNPHFVVRKVSGAADLQLQIGSARLNLLPLAQHLRSRCSQFKKGMSHASLELRSVGGVPQ